MWERSVFMHFEADFSNMAKEDKNGRQDTVIGAEFPGLQENRLERCFSCLQEKGEHETPLNLKKKKQLMNMYERLKNVAMIQNGKIILDINEENQHVKLIYWGKELIFFNQQEDHRSILMDVLKEYPLIYIESVKNGIQLTVNESLYD